MRQTHKMLTLLKPAGGGAPGFIPTDLTSLTLWLDADDAATLFQDRAGTTPAASDGDPVGQWADKSGNNFHAQQATTANKPTLKLAIQNGRNVIRCDGNDVLLLSGAALDMFRNQSFAYIFAVYSNTTSGAKRVIYANTGALNTRISIADGKGAHYAQARQLDADTVVVATSSVVAGGAVSIVSVLSEWIAGDLTLRLNGQAVASAAYADTKNTSDVSSSEVSIAGRDIGLDAITGDIAEMLVYTPSLAFTASEISSVEAYLASKWGITLS